MAPFWQNVHNSSSREVGSASSGLASEERDENNLLGTKQTWIPKEEWYSPGERASPNDRKLKFSDDSPREHGEIRCEFVEVVSYSCGEPPVLPARTIGKIGQVRHHGKWEDGKFIIRHEKGPDLKSWLEKEFVWSHMTIDNRDEAPVRSQNSRLQKMLKGFKLNPTESKRGGEGMPFWGLHDPRSAVQPKVSLTAEPGTEESSELSEVVATNIANAIPEIPALKEPTPNKLPTEVVPGDDLQICVQVAEQRETPSQDDEWEDEPKEVEHDSKNSPPIFKATMQSTYGPTFEEITYECPPKPILRGTRILLVDCHVGYTTDPDLHLPFRELEYRTLQEALGAPSRELATTLMESTGQATRHSAKNSKGEVVDCFIFKLGIQTTGYYTVVISYNVTRDITTVLILAQTRKDGFEAIKSWFESDNVRSWKLETFATIRILVDGILAVSSNSIETIDMRLSLLQARMGQHTYRGRERGDPLKLDFTWATRVLNHASTILAMNKMRVKGVQKVVKKTQAYDAIIAAKRKAAARDRENLQSNSSVVGDGLTEFLEGLEDHCENLLDRIEYDQQRVQTQLAAAYTFMAAKDNILNISLASDSKKIAASSKRDSSAMKTIAVLTMLFLPATFVAALFAMPLFNWDAARGTSVFKPYFKYYWAITVPLTFVVILVWSLVLLLPWRDWVPQWYSTRSDTDSTISHSFGSVLDSDTSQSLCDD